MKRTQIQLPEALYREVRRLAEEQEWSVAEVLRRGAEYMVACYPPGRDQSWTLPDPMPLGQFKIDVALWREQTESPEERL